MNASLPYGPLMNTDTEYYQTFLVVSFVRKEASVCLIMLSAKQGSHCYHF